MGSTIAGFFITYIFTGNLDIILLAIMILGIIALITYNVMLKRQNVINIDQKIEKLQKVKIKFKKKLNIKESLSFLLKSKYLVLIAVLVISYSMSISLIESIIKDKWADFAQGDKNVLSKIGGSSIMMIGILSTIFAFFSTYLQRKRWLYTALFTPITFCLIGFVLFVFMNFSDNIPDVFYKRLDITPLFTSVILGWLNLVIIKASKYSFFEPSKEATYIPLGENIKVNGKAAVDGVGSRLGKGLSSILLTIFILPFGNGKIINIQNVIFIILGAILMMWLWAVIKLDKRFGRLVKEKRKQ